jgi:FAD/FMN-containing dehydrogenase
MQYRLPLGHVTEFVQGLPYGLRERLAFECLVAKAHPSVSVRLFFTRPQHGAENRFIADELLHHAEALGGVPYGTGLLYRQAADRVYGSNVLARMHAFQLEADPAGRLNPGKAFPD